MQASGQYGVPPEVPQFVVGRVPSATTAAVAAAASASSHSHMFSLSHDMPVSNSSSQQNPNPHPPPPQQQQMVTQKIRLESDSREVLPSPNLNNNNSNTDSFNKQLVPVGNNEQQQVQVGGGEEDVLDCERGSVGNRWPRQETLALLKIRSEMDANFRDASLKGPLWEDVSRRLADLGYYRSAKKCKEKFENVHKYYKRTKEGRAGRQDGKSYKFFSQLEALYGSSNATHNSNHNNNNDGSSNNNNGNSNKVTVAAIGGGAAAAITAAGNLPATATAPLGVSTREIINPTSTIKTTTTTATAAVAAAVNPTAVDRPALDFSAAAAAFNFSSESSSEDEYDEPEESEQTDHVSRKRKRSSSMTAFFENLMKQVIEKQEAMQQKFLEAIEKREQDRMIREEAWKRQEIARLSREQELKSQERSLTATRDAALVAFLQKVTGQTIPIPQLPSIIQPQNIAPPPPPPPPPLPDNQHSSDQEHHNQECKELVTYDHNSKRWPKPEVLALIKLRSGMEQRFHEAGPKGPLWEEISQGMSYLGYSRSAKRCKEKWENINKYFRKAKESNKKRPENAKTCPYFHQLDALYRKKILGNPSKQNKIMEQGYEGGGGGHDQQNKIIIMQEDQNLIEPQQCKSSREDNSAHTQPGEHGTASAAATDILAIMPPPPAGSETHAVTYHHERTSSSTTRDASFMAMVQKLAAAPDPAEFNMSTSSNTE